jgi:magnesium transporter
VDNRQKMITASIHKFYKRGAFENVRRIYLKSHEADLAAALNGFAKTELFELFMLEKNLSKRSKILAYLSEQAQSDILEALSIEQAREVIGELESDDAADILSLLDEDVADSIIQGMSKEDSNDVVDLMAYPDDSAGGIMSSDYLAVEESTTVEECIKIIQEKNDELVTFYIYVVNETGHLIGVLSLKQLLLARPYDKVKDLMLSDVIRAEVDDPQDSVARMVEKYDFLSVPVVEENNKLVGIVTVDDVIDVIREEANEEIKAMGQVGFVEESTVFNLVRSRIAWLLLSFVGGALSFSLAYTFLGRVLDVQALPVVWQAAAFVTMLLAIGATVSQQATTIGVSFLRELKLEGRRVRGHVLREIMVTLVFSVILGGLTYAGSVVMGLTPMVAVTFTASVALLISMSSILGNLMPVLFERLDFDPTVASVPVVTTLTDLVAISVLFLLLELLSVA